MLTQPLKTAVLAAALCLLPAWLAQTAAQTQPDARMFAQPDSLRPDANSKIIHINNADELEILELGKEQIRKLIGSVYLQQEDLHMQCDSAIVYREKNELEAFGSVYIQQGDSVEINAEYLNYDGNTKTAVLYNNVFLTDHQSDIYADSLHYFAETKKAILFGKVHLTDHRQDVYADSLEYFVRTKDAALYNNAVLTDNEGMEIFSDRMDYNVNTQKGSYTGGGILVKNETTLESEEGFYNGVTDKVRFERNVHMQSPDYDLKTQTLNYDLKTEVAEFKGDAVIRNNQQTIFAQSGRYDTRTDQLKLDQRANIYSGNRQITADDFHYDKATGKGRATGNVLFVDTLRKLTIKSGQTDFFEKDERVEAFGNVLLADAEGRDTLYLSADTLLSYRVALPADSLGRRDSVQNVKAFRNVKILKGRMQGACDSLFYSLKDSVFRMFVQPVVWTDNYQLFADTILLHTKNDQPHKLELLENAFIAQQLQAGVYNQIKGNIISGHLKEGEMERLIISQFAESIYYAQDDTGDYIGVNQSKSEDMEVFFSAGKVSRIKFVEKPQATFHPIADIRPAEMILPGFKWLQKQRPLTLADLTGGSRREIDAPKEQKQRGRGQAAEGESNPKASKRKGRKSRQAEKEEAPQNN